MIPTEELIVDKLEQDSDLLKNLCFTDACTFTLKTISKIHYWFGILEDKIVGRMPLNQNLTEDSFVDMLENTIEPLIVQALEYQIDGDMH